jgi:hypothetical protein
VERIRPWFGRASPFAVFHAEGPEMRGRAEFSFVFMGTAEATFTSVSGTSAPFARLVLRLISAPKLTCRRF